MQLTFLDDKVCEVWKESFCLWCFSHLWICQASIIWQNEGKSQCVYKGLMMMPLILLKGGFLMLTHFAKIPFWIQMENDTFKAIFWNLTVVEA